MRRRVGGAHKLLGAQQAIADHLAGMTDSYCNSEYRQLVVE